MNILWLGHGSFRIEIADQVLLIDPWITGNPMLDADQAQAATNGATHILVTHGHFDHTADVVAISKATGAPVSAVYELGKHLHGAGAVEGHAFGKGGTITLGAVTATLVPASHSSSIDVDGRGVYMGAECGFILKGEGKVIYVSGDTDIMADMDWIGAFHKPDIGILSAGGYFTMDMAGAAYAAKRYFNFSTVIPCHYRTFPLLEQSAQALTDGLPDVTVIEPQVMKAIPF
ncbi:MAG: metal-dependent hydrolase [Pseudomonadota bacterium]